jgi:hypothetical protein
MRISTPVGIIIALLVMGAGKSEAAFVWADGNSLAQVIGYDLEGHESGRKLTSYQMNEVCLLLGYFRGFAEAGAIAEHYDATSLPFILPDSITSQQIEQVVYQFLADNPDKLNEKGEALVVAALAKEYPNPSFEPVIDKGAGPKGKE